MAIGGKPVKIACLTSEHKLDLYNDVQTLNYISVEQALNQHISWFDHALYIDRV